jgi:hypothetical protein
MIEQDYILLILNCVKYCNKALKQKKTWLQELPNNLIYFHIIGDPNLTNDYLFDHNNNILYVNCKDDYNSLPKKVINAYSAISKEYQFKYIFKTDDDQELTNKTFFQTLMKVLNINSVNSNLKPQYGGYIVDVKVPYICKYNLIHPELPDNLIINQGKYCSGRFYFLSEEAVADLLFKKDLIKAELLEDYAIGTHLLANFKTNIFFIDTNSYFKDFF